MISRLISSVLLIYVLGYALFVLLLPRTPYEGRTDGIVVLTGAKGRIERGLALMQHGQAKRMLISGVERTVTPADLAKHYGAREALFQCCIELGRESVDTRSNAEETAQWLRRNKFKSVRLVTTDWHMPRAKFELKRQTNGDIDVIADPVPSNPSFTQMFTEYNKYLLRRAAVIVGI